MAIHYYGPFKVYYYHYPHGASWPTHGHSRANILDDLASANPQWQVLTESFYFRVPEISDHNVGSGVNYNFATDLSTAVIFDSTHILSDREYYTQILFKPSAYTIPSIFSPILQHAYIVDLDITANQGGSFDNFWAIAFMDDNNLVEYIYNCSMSSGEQGVVYQGGLYINNPDREADSSTRNYWSYTGYMPLGQNIYPFADYIGYRSYYGNDAGLIAYSHGTVLYDPNTNKLYRSYMNFDYSYPGSWDRHEFYYFVDTDEIDSGMKSVFFSQEAPEPPTPTPGPEPPPEQDPAYNGESNASVGGGDGDYDNTNTDSHEDITLPNQLVDDTTLTDYVNIAGIFPYYLTDAQLNEFMMYLNLFKFGDGYDLYNVRNYILSVKRVPYTPAYKSTDVAMRFGLGFHCNYIQDGTTYSVYAKPIAEEYTKLVFDYVDINEYWGSFLDYHPYTKIKLYLPFYGYVYVNANLVMNRSVKIIYTINNITTIAHIEVIVKYTDEYTDEEVEQTLMQLTTQPLGYDQPYNAADYKELANAIIQTGIYAAGGIAAGAAGVIGADVVTETKTITESIPYSNIQEYKNALNFLRDSGVNDYRQVNTGSASGSFEFDNNYEETTRIPKKVENPIKPPSVQSTVDALLNMDSITSNGSNGTTLLSQKTPLIYIERPILQYPKDAYAKLYGIPLNMYLHLGDLTGFTVVSDYRDDSLTCTEQEKRLIEDLLKGGVVL